MVFASRRYTPYPTTGARRHDVVILTSSDTVAYLTRSPLLALAAHFPPMAAVVAEPAGLAGLGPAGLAGAAPPPPWTLAVSQFEQVVERAGAGEYVR